MTFYSSNAAPPTRRVGNGVADTTQAEAPVCEPAHADTAFVLPGLIFVC